MLAFKYCAGYFDILTLSSSSKMHSQKTDFTSSHKKLTKTRSWAFLFLVDFTAAIKWVKLLQCKITVM